jgi:AcrR family transcriptional regulator
LATLWPVTSPLTLASNRPHPVHYSDPQLRIITAALELFAEHGVSGTSLQMIANAIGVTKAAVYHQFNTKEEIVLATAEYELRPLREVLDVAGAEPNTNKAREMIVSELVDLAVKRRHLVRVLQNDPVMARFLAEHEPFRELMDRLYRFLMPGEATAEARLQAAMFSAAIGGVLSHPLVADLDDDTLRLQLMRFTRQILHLPQRRGR